ncbi:unnamed protein product [Thelazia callipaeda]|uniref:EGF-like domain-containing protein n=1 Tax=Thelazia callipaeda TaxID=103827 RepID=A0A0N5D654_THECL|nr:unnamed protein product [Thelazia callipaeda]
MRGCSTRSRYEQKKSSQSHRFAELEECTEAYSGYCRNGGICKMTADISQRAVPHFFLFISCPTGFRGRQCELINDPNIYFSQQQGQIEIAAMSSLVVTIVLAISFASFLLYVYRRYLKYGLHRSTSSLSNLTSLELSSSKPWQRRNSKLSLNDFKEAEAEKSVHVHLATRLDDNDPSTVFEMLSQADCPKMQVTSPRNFLIMTTQNRNIPRKVKTAMMFTSQMC